MPKSSFAWVDSEGNGHLPYKNADGSINVAHTRNALARLNQVKGMPEDVRRRVRAKLEAALQKAKNASEFEFLNVLDFAEIETTPEGFIWVDAFKPGEWYDARYGVTPIDDQYLESIIKNFNDNVRGIEIAVDYNHGEDKAKGDKAAAWIRGLRRTGEGLVQAALDFTEEAAKEIRDRQWRYFSPRFTDNYVHSEGGQEFGPTMLMGSLTNTPVFKGMAPINFSEAVLDAEMTLIPEDSVPAPLPEPTPKPDDKEGEVDEAQLRKMLGIAEDASIEDSIKALQTDAKNFAELKKAAEQHKNFAEQFPDEYKRQQDLAERVTRAEAKEFAEFLTKPVELADGKESKVFPPKVAETVEEVYREFSEGHGTLDGFKKVMASIRETGLVELGEKGKSTEDGKETPASDSEAIRQFSEKMGDIMREEKLAPHDAMMKAAKENPELYQAYINREIPVK